MQMLFLRSARANKSVKFIVYLTAHIADSILTSSGQLTLNKKHIKLKPAPNKTHIRRILSYRFDYICS